MCDSDQEGGELGQAMPYRARISEGAWRPEPHPGLTSAWAKLSG